MKILIQNLQKRGGLATELLEEYNPDVMLLQEINLYAETRSDFFPAHNVSRMGYGTAIGGKFEISNIKCVQSPYAEIGGVVHKKTTIASIQSVQFISFHGYNGQPFKNKEKLVTHVEAVLKVLPPDQPALFAGDFNTWSQEHLDAVTSKLESAGFHLVYSWPYPDRDLPLDHAFLRDMELISSTNYACSSDHRGAILELNVKISE